MYTSLIYSENSKIIRRKEQPCAALYYRQGCTVVAAIYCIVYCKILCHHFLSGDDTQLGGFYKRLHESGQSETVRTPGAATRGLPADCTRPPGDRK